MSVSPEPSGCDPVRFAYWVPNVSGGLVTSTIEQRTDWGYDYNRELAVLAENNGFDYPLTQVRYMASYGAEFQHESTSFSLALLLATQRLKVIAAVHPGLWHPGVLAKLGATRPPVERALRRQRRQRLVQGRVHRPRRAVAGTRRALPPLRGVHPRPAPDLAEDHTELAGDFYRLRDFSLKPKPLNTPQRPHPEIFQGGNSTAARAMAGRVSDWYFSNGRDFDGVTEQINDVRASATQIGRREPKFGLNGFLIARDTEAEARETLREIVAKADTRAVHGFRDAVQQAGPSTTDGKGMWQDSGFEDLVQYNDGFRTGLIGTPEQIAERIVAYKRLGVDLFLLGFLHYLEEVEYFGKKVLPLVRELEAQKARSDPAAAHA